MHCFNSFFYYFVFLGLTLLRVITFGAFGEAEFSCVPLKVAPREKTHCVIKFQLLGEKPTVVFDLKQFSVSTQSSVKGVTLDVSPLRSGVDLMTAVFDISASEATNITVNVKYTLDGKDVLIRNSGLVLYVLSWPAVRMGPVVCDVPSAGLSLRAITTCRADLYDNNHRSAVVYKNDIKLVEKNNLGRFAFISGTGELVFSFRAANAPYTTETSFVFFVTINRNGNVYSVSFPLLYPNISPVASASILRCSKKNDEFVCMLNALDAIGPVQLRLADFRVTIDTLDENSLDAKWIENTKAFNVSINILENINTAIISWHRWINNVIQAGRIHVYIKSTDAGSNETSFEEIQGSPFGFLTGVIPTASSVSLRGCEVSLISSGNRTRCFIDLKNASGDVRYFHLFSELDAVLENITYIPVDSVSHSPVISFVYVAPPVRTHSMDHITLLVGGQNAVFSPFRISVFSPVLATVSSGGDAKNKRAHNSIIIAVGLVYYGAIIFFGFFFAVQRTIRVNRIRRQRALRALQKQTTEEQEMNSKVGNMGAESVEQAGSK